jgi:hypothetical protein
MGGDRDLVTAGASRLWCSEALDRTAVDQDRICPSSNFTWLTVADAALILEIEGSAFQCCRFAYWRSPFNCECMVIATPERVNSLYKSE